MTERPETQVVDRAVRILHWVFVSLWLGFGVVVSVVTTLSEPGYWPMGPLIVGFVWAIVLPVVIASTIVFRLKPTVPWVLGAHILLPNVVVPAVTLLFDSLR